MTDVSELSFEQWVSFLFDREVPDSCSDAWYWDADFDYSDRHKNLRFCAELFEGPGFLLDRFSQAQVNQALWFIANECHSFMWDLWAADVHRSLRERTAAGMYPLFEEPFARACSPTLSAHNREPGLPLNSACYMWWDILAFDQEQAGGPVGRRLFDVMTRTLRLNHPACVESALHGLGHWPLREEAERAIDEFLDEQPVISAALKSYARAAQDGGIL